jgi:nicotinate-nucleotide adenylyltransferase
MTPPSRGKDADAASPAAALSPAAAWALKRAPHAEPGMRVGLMGGSFNPAHSGHRHVALQALKRLSLHRVWCLVSPGNPLKSASELADFDLRLTAAARLLRHPRIDVTGFEAKLRSAYTIDALRFLKRRYPAVRFVWIMGGDNLACFHRWRCWREILALAPIAVFDRPNWRLPALSSPAAGAGAHSRVAERRARSLTLTQPPAWTFISIPLSSLSSTALRRTRAADS